MPARPGPHEIFLIGCPQQSFVLSGGSKLGLLRQMLHEPPPVGRERGTPPLPTRARTFPRLIPSREQGADLSPGAGLAPWDATGENALVIDGVYTRPTPRARPVFHRLLPPADADIAALLTRLHRRVRRFLTRRGRPLDADAGSDPFAAQEPLFAPTVAASLQGRVALGPRAGQPVRRLRSAAAVTSAGPRCARLEGFSLHADVAVPARRRDRLEHLVRYLVRPPLALARLTESSGAQLLYQFRRPWRDGSTALLLDPLELLARRHPPSGLVGKHALRGLGSPPAA